MNFTDDELTKRADIVVDTFVTQVRDDNVPEQILREIYGDIPDADRSPRASAYVFGEVLLYGACCLAINAAPRITKRQFLVFSAPDKSGWQHFTDRVIDRVTEILREPGARADIIEYINDPARASSRFTTHLAAQSDGFSRMDILTIARQIEQWAVETLKQELR